MAYQEQSREIEQNPEKSFLSPREIEILVLISRGLANKQIARELEISKQTVKNHVSLCLRKLDAPDRTRAVVIFTQALAFLSQSHNDFTFKEFQEAIFVFSKSKNEMPFVSALPRLNELLDAKDAKRKAKERKRAVISALLHNPEERNGEITTAQGWSSCTIRMDIHQLYKKHGIKHGYWKKMRRQLVEKIRESEKI